MSNHNSEKTEKRSFLLLLLVLLFAGGVIFYPFIKVLILALVFAVLFYPLHEKFLKWTNRPNLSAFFSVLSVVLLLLIPTAVILTLVTQQLAAVVSPEAFQASQTTLSGILNELQQRVTHWAVKFESLAGFHFDLVPWVQKGMTKVAQILAKYSPTVLSETANFFLHSFVMIIALFYLFRDGRFILNAAIRISPVKDQYERRLTREIKLTINGVFYGSFLSGLAQAALATVGFYFVDIPGYYVWGILTFFMSFIPMVGTGAVIFPLVLILFIQGRVGAAIFLAVYGAIAIGSVDNLLRPVLIRSNMHPLVLFLSVFGGLVVFGAIGILVGPMLLAMLTATVRIYAKDFAHIRMAELEGNIKNSS